MFRLTTGAPAVGVYASYDLTHMLGQGSFANVYKAVHRGGAGVFAVKLIDLKKCRHSTRAELDEHGQIRHPFQREITLMESFSHPNVCKMREIFLEPDTLCACPQWRE
jgi:serine/threonine/tyrosine protein kinase RAD53